LYIIDSTVLFVTMKNRYLVVFALILSAGFYLNNRQLITVDHEQNINFGDDNILVNSSGNCKNLESVSGYVAVENNTKIDVSSILNVKVVKAPSSYVKWTGSTSDGKSPIVRSDNDLLKLTQPNGCSKDMQIEVGTSTEFANIRASGVSQLSFSPESTTADLNINAEGVSNVEVLRNLTHVTINASGTAEVKADVVKTANLNLSGVSKTYINQLNTASGKMDGVSELHTSRNTLTNLDVTGIAKVVRH
jgi:hypothetical protein